MPRTAAGPTARSSLALAIVAVAIVAIAFPAAAQSIGGNSRPGDVARPTVGTAPDAKPREPAPPALPGSRAEATAVAPADRNASELPPTEALFDAINRGDTPAARDAINRGADLSGRNVLGLTPLELAVDLGRNDITFVLLSLRGSDTSGPPPGAATGGAAAGATSRQAAAERRAREREAREQRRQEILAARAARTQPSAPAQPTRPRLFARDGGAPVPQAGFLGFDPVR